MIGRSDALASDGCDGRGGAASRRPGRASQVETRLLREALADESLTVFALAAGVVLEPELLSGALIVWLRVTATGEADSIARGGQQRRPRPGDAAVALSRLYAERQSLYAQVASVAVEVAADARGDL